MADQEYRETSVASRGHPEAGLESRLAVLAVPLDRFPALDGLLWRSSDGKARSPTPWFRQDGHICYLYRFPQDVPLDLPLERDGVRLIPFDPSEDVVWGLPPAGFGPVRTVWKLSLIHI